MMAAADGREEMLNETTGDKISIIIVTMNSASFISACLQSLRDQRAPFPVEIIVVDNASTDATMELVRSSFPGVRCIGLPKNNGFNAGNNAGIRASEGNVILLLNPDTVVHEQVLESLLRALKSGDDIAGAGPQILNGDGSLQRTGVAFPSLWNTCCEILFLDKTFPRSRIFGRHRRLYEDPGSSFTVDYLQGSCLMLKKDRLGAAGMLDEGYFMYFDEADLCRRLRDRGWRIVYDPSSKITHFGGGGTTFYDNVRLTHFYQSYLRYLTLHEHLMRRTAFRFLLIVRAVVRLPVFLLGAIASRSRTHEYIERMKAYGNVIGILMKNS